MSRSARSVALDVLMKVEQAEAFSNLELNHALKASKLDRQDASLVTELVYGTLQRQNTLDYFLSRFATKGLHKLQPWVLVLLRLSLYQMLYLDRIPPHAAVNEAVNIAKKRGHRGVAGMVNGILRNAERNRDSLTIPDHLPLAKRISLQHSHPEWLVKRWLAQYGEEETVAMCADNNRPPHVSVRVNRLRSERERMLTLLREQGIEAEPSLLSKDGIVILSRGGNLAHSDWYRGGALSIQDESSMVVAAIVDSKPGMRVLDCCAAPGGKTTHIAETMNDEGEVWANDLHEHKQALIQDQARRLGLRSIRTLVSDAAQLGERFPAAHFDRILLDAPCSGLGVIRRKPDIKWRKTPEELRGLPDLQLELLKAASSLLRPGGVLVYSTCTVEPDENERVIAKFLEQHAPHFVPDRELPSLVPESLHPNIDRETGSVRILPHHYGSDGFFIARLRLAKS